MAVLVLAAAAGGCGGDEPSPPAAGPVRAAPRWEHVTTFTGTGDQRTSGFEIGAGAIQWRVTLACSDGGVRVALDGGGPALAELTACPGPTFGFSIRTGAATLEVTATGSWEVVVDQQLDTPAAEPALEAMTAATRLAGGEFYGIDQKGSGRATLFRLPGDRLALRFDPFLVTSNSDLFVWVSEAPAPGTSEEALRSPHVQIDRLTATAGAQNYLLPDSVDAGRVRSVVVWCEPVRTAYAAATLEP